MSAGTSAAPTPRLRVGKKALAKALGWGRPRLDNRLASDPNFPIAARGTQRGGWVFDFDAVCAYLQVTCEPPPESIPVPQSARIPAGLRASIASARCRCPGACLIHPTEHQVGKRDLAVALGWGRPALDRHIDRDPDFPVVTRGTQAGGWMFDLRAVRTYLVGCSAPPEVHSPQALPPS
jgi:hypothetical protein